jgi:hypothetical protein
VITVEFWREEHLRRHPEHIGAVFVAEIEAEELGGILRDAAAVLGSDPTGRDDRMARGRCAELPTGTTNGEDRE